MNERIRELAEQAAVLADFGKDIKEGRWAIGGNYQSIERFAQLIVKECANKIGENFAGAIGSHASAHNTAVKQCQQTILKHFGVE